MKTVRDNILVLSKSKVVKSFMATGISKRMKVPLEEVIEELDKLIDEGLVQKRYQLICLSDNCYRVLDTQDDKADFQSEYECKFCGEEHEEISDMYISEVYCGVKQEVTN